MGKQKNKLSSSQRWAIWTAYSMKCFWCKKALDFTDCEIDNVIPNSTSRIVLTSLKKDYQLGDDFSLNDYANWVPSCVPCSKKRSKSAFRPVPGLFDLIRNKIPMVDGKVRQIEAEATLKSLLQELVKKLEQGELSREDVERVAGPFIKAVEGTPKGNVEFRFSSTVRLFVSPDGMRLQAPSEIRYEKFVENMVESGDWKKQKSVERLKEGPTFGEGRPRKPGGGA